MTTGERLREMEQRIAHPDWYLPLRHLGGTVLMYVGPPRAATFGLSAADAARSLHRAFGSPKPKEAPLSPEPSEWFHEGCAFGVPAIRSTFARLAIVAGARYVSLDPAHLKVYAIIRP